MHSMLWVPRRALLSTAAAAVMLSACVVGDDYERPEIDVPVQWRLEIEEANDYANLAWWHQFDDPIMTRLIETALEENRDIRQAAARVDEFLGALRSVRSQYFPQVNYGGDVSRNRSSEEVFDLGNVADPYYTQYQAAIGTAWQIDLFGRIRRQTEAAQARVYASEQGRRGVILSVTAGVATSYVVLRGLDEQLDISRATAKNYLDSLEIFRLRYKHGTVSRLEVAQIESQYQQARAAIPVFESQVAAQENLLSILLGQNPAPIVRGQTLDNMSLPGVPESLPADLLERRPDLVQAEQNLVAANAEVGVARSLYYPDISITGAYGAASSDLDDFLDSSARAWNISGNISGPIFTAGGIAGQVQSAEAARQQSEEFYRQAILNALREVNSALVATEKNDEAFKAQSARVAALRDYAKLADLRFENGAASYLEVLYANNELFEAELSAVDARIAHYSALIDVYKSMGGGWVDEAVTLAPTVEEVMSREN